MSNLFVGPMFEILAGPNHTKFLAHPSILKNPRRLEPSYRANGKTAPSSESCWIDWDPETVGRLLEWLYSGDYESPYPTKVPQPGAEVLEVPVPETSVPSNSNAKEGSQSTPKSESAKGSQRPLIPLAKYPFNETDPELRPCDAEAFKQWVLKFPHSPCVLDFQASLLTHAKLYALADYMLLPTLKAQSFQRLKALLLFISAPTYSSAANTATLSLPVTNTPVIGNIVALVRYVYANTTRLESEDEPLRGLISTFIALHYDQFDDEGGEVSELVKQGGDFVVDLHDKVRRNVIALKQEVVLLETKVRGENEWSFGLLE